VGDRRERDLRLFDTPTADILRRLFGERRLVNGAPQRRDETTGRDFESDGQEAELGRAGRKPRLHSAEWRSWPRSMACARGFNRCLEGLRRLLPEPTPSPRLWAASPGATPARLCEHTMRGFFKPSK
jgi:hypothetical protein